VTLAAAHDGPRDASTDVADFLQVRQLSKHFGGVQALKAVDIGIRPGEVHGLVGANGAGKSTLIRILAGVHRPDSGRILLDGRLVEVRDPEQASALGLSFIHQELNLVPKFSVVQNMLLGLSKPTRLGLLDWSAMRAQAQAVARRLDMQVALDAPVEQLSVAERWLVSIGRALVRQARLIAMDEPTASLSDREAERLFHIIRELAAAGIAILYVSHRLDEILSLCQRVTLFRDGASVATVSGQSLTKKGLIDAIAGREIANRTVPTGHRTAGAVVIEARGLRRAPAVRDVSFALHAGEVLGFAGLVGAGRTELARLIFGADTPEGGAILIDARPVHLSGTDDAVRRGIALVPEERRSEGLVLKQTIAFNINLASWGSLRWVRWLPLISHRRGARQAAATAQRLRVKAPSVQTLVRQLSGGNQQKVVIGKWLGRAVRALILDEPTRGVDVGAREEIHKIIRELADNGIGVMMISSEFEELLGCDRVLVMVEGRIAGELRGDDISEEAMLHLCYAHLREAEAR